jgi:methyl-accepting chemotaxis protein
LRTERTAAPAPPPARWDLVGLAAGAALAACALVLTGIMAGSLAPSALARAHASTPILFLTDLAPLALALLGAAVRRDQLRAAAHAAAEAERAVARQASARRTALELTAASQDVLARVSSILAACTQTSKTVGETADTVQRLTGTAMQSALEAETVIGIAQRSERMSETAGAVADSTGQELLGLSSDVKAMAEQIQDLHLNVRHLLDVATTMAWLAQRSQGLAATAVKAALTGDVESFHTVAGDMRGHADDALWAAKQAEALIAEVADAMAKALDLAEAGTKRAATGAQVVQQTGVKIRSLGQALRESAAASARIAQVAQGQGGSFDRVLTAMNEIWFATETNVVATQAVAEAARKLDALAAELGGAVGEPAAPAATPPPDAGPTRATSEGPGEPVAAMIQSR